MMRRSFPFFSVVAISFAILMRTSSADLIATTTTLMDQGSKFESSLEFMEMTMLLDPTDLLWTNPNRTILFDGIAMTPGDVGRTFELTAQDDPDFAAAVILLTNGINDKFGWEAILHNPDGTPRNGSIWNSNESKRFGSIPGGNGIDLGGFIITKITQRLDALSLTYDPGESYPWRMYAETTLFFEGRPIPEPATIALLSLGSVAPLLLRRKSA